eukprot:CAMPEP_0174338550 /NCGR_PEP_ID=MMETSP0810-20121108/23218_1 /TAXON_ID=73025 ORGANISM="Eutreptiella gymnastica-like, Strain CCMP1594" /NCGR_SAMPLE_ID=MMETSP0810 /ASSEMBLY_ACC=CAM_ASM_000659 /LENGTH=78 /DNA_ID=CAMNT_0015458687 /DNA_START=52 /DNA_END=288 /DNA_ORIENTATION=+
MPLVFGSGSEPLRPGASFDFHSGRGREAALWNPFLALLPPYALGLRTLITHRHVIPSDRHLTRVCRSWDVAVVLPLKI